MDEKIQRNRYSLIIETVDGKTYCYNAKDDCLQLIYSEKEELKYPLNVIDYITCKIKNQEEFCKIYGLNTPVRLMYIKYYLKEAKFLAPSFNNEKWANVAKSMTYSVVDFKNSNNKDAFNDIYLELTNKDSSFGNLIIKNENKSVRISQKLKQELVLLLAHEKAILNKKKYGVYGSFEAYNRVRDLYISDKSAFYFDLKKRLTNYRDFRSLYLNLCKYKESSETRNNEKKEEQNIKIKHLAPQQISMFD